MHGMDMESGLLNYDHGSHDAEAQVHVQARVGGDCTALHIVFP